MNTLEHQTLLYGDNCPSCQVYTSGFIKIGMPDNNGRKPFNKSWIHELDVARAIDFLIGTETLNGHLHLAVPKPSNNKTLMSSFRKVMHIPFGIPLPEWLIKLGAELIGTEPELVLKSRNVIPKRLLDNGFKFIHSDIEIALDDLLK